MRSCSPRACRRKATSTPATTASSPTRDQPLVLHPDLTDETDYPTREAGSCAPFVSDEANVRPVWQRLAERAAALGQPAPQRDTTTDADLHIVAKGRTVRPLYGENGPVHLRPAEGRDGGARWSHVPARRPTCGRGWMIAAAWACMWSGSCCAARARCGTSRSTIRACRRAGGRWSGTERPCAGGPMARPCCRCRRSHGPTMLEIRAGSGGMSYVINADQDRRVGLAPARCGIKLEITKDQTAATKS